MKNLTHSTYFQYNLLPASKIAISLSKLYPHSDLLYVGFPTTPQPKRDLGKLHPKLSPLRLIGGGGD